MIKSILHLAHIGIVFIAVKAESVSFLHDMATIADAYYELGHDNNYLDMKLLSKEQFLANNPSDSALSYSELKEIIAVVKECVFMKKGAYGEHFSDEMHDVIAQNFADKLYNIVRQNNPIVQVFSIKEQADMATGIFNAPCVLGILSNDRILLMQGAAMD